MWSKSAVWGRFLFPAESYLLNADWLLVNKCGCKSWATIRTALVPTLPQFVRISNTITLVTSQVLVWSDYNWWWDPGSLYIEAISPAWGYRFPVGWLLPMFFRAEIIILVAQLNHGSLDTTMMCLYRDEQKHGAFLNRNVVSSLKNV
jgi:hypothetical protein